MNLFIISDQGINFVELEGAMQMFIVGEVHIGSSISSNRCWDTCMGIPYHPGLINFDCSEKSGNMWCPIRNCYGRLYDCESASSTTVCELVIYFFYTEKKEHLYILIINILY